jgi:hypothetical protein
MLNLQPGRAEQSLDAVLHWTITAEQDQGWRDLSHAAFQD